MRFTVEIDPQTGGIRESDMESLRVLCGDQELSEREPRFPVLVWENDRSPCP